MTILVNTPTPIRMANRSQIRVVEDLDIKTATVLLDFADDLETSEDW